MSIDQWLVIATVAVYGIGVLGLLNCHSRLISGIRNRIETVDDKVEELYCDLHVRIANLEAAAEETK